MKKILITGANSYIGVSFENYMMQFGDEYLIDTIDMVDGSWKNASFAEFDVIFHVAGIAHQKETKENAELYYIVNRDLPIAVAEKARREGVKQFIFLSSMSVYGIDQGTITSDTVTLPTSNYGKSKLEAENELKSIANEFFGVAILRPPMVYGKGCKGNYQMLRKLALKLPIFPDIKNERSMVYIDNLCEFVRKVIDDRCSGVFYPQNCEYVNTGTMVKMIAENHARKIHITKLLTPFVKFSMRFGVKKVTKAFGNLTYEKTDIVDHVSFVQSMKQTEDG